MNQAYVIECIGDQSKGMPVEVRNTDVGRSGYLGRVEVFSVSKKQKGLSTKVEKEKI